MAPECLGMVTCRDDYKVCLSPISEGEAWGRGWYCRKQVALALITLCWYNINKTRKEISPSLALPPIGVLIKIICLFVYYAEHMLHELTVVIAD